MTRAPALGRFHHLTITAEVEGGVQLDGGASELFVPTRQLPPGAEVGERLRVFVFLGRDGGLEATTVEPVAALGAFGRMRCVSVTTSGAYVDWGLPKDLYIPPREQAHRMAEGEDYVVVVCMDRKGEQLIGSTHLASHFDYEVESVQVDDEVDLLVYGRIEAGVQVVVDQRHRGLVHHSDVYGDMPIGALMRGFVRAVRDDNRLDIALKPRGRAGRDDAQSTILDALEAAGGSLPLHDRSRPEEIVARLNLSKKAFKRGVGMLYKARKIVMTEGGIALAPSESPPVNEET